MRHRKVQSAMIKVMLSLMLVFTLLPVHSFANAQELEGVQEDFVESSDKTYDDAGNPDAPVAVGDDEEEVDSETTPDDESGSVADEDGEESENDEQPVVEEESDVVTEPTLEILVEEDSKEEGTESEDEADEEADEEEEIEGFNFTIMHMNDTHANLDPMPQMFTAIQEVRAEVEHSLLLHAGDVFSGTLYFNQFKGQADLAMMNLLGFDAMVYGNHEFDLGSGEGGHKSLADFVSKANFPLLGTNLDFSDDPYMSGLEVTTPLVENALGGKTYHSIVKNIDGEKVGIFGLTTEDTIAISSPMSVEFLNYYTTAVNAVEQFENAGINKVIALTHIGYNSNPAVGNDLLLAQVDGIDVIVGGHTHTALSEPVVVEADGQDPTVIVQAGQYTQNLGRLDVTFDEEGVIVDHKGGLIPIKEQDANPVISDALKEFSDEIEELSNTPSGAVAVKDLANPRSQDGGDSVRANETELGNLVTDAMLAKAQEKFPETVIAVQNGGGIRAPIAAGPITIGEIISVLPFGNDPVVAEITGAELKEILEHSVSRAPAENGGFLHVAGMKFTYDSSQKPGNRVVTMEVNTDGNFVPIDMEETYLITTNVFTGQGGDGFETFAKAYAEGRVTNIGEIDWEQLMDYMVNEKYLGGEVDPVREGRIIDVAPEIHEIEVDQEVEVFGHQLVKVKDTAISILLPEDLPEGTKLVISLVEEDDAAGDVVDVDLQLPGGHENYEGTFVLTLGVGDDSVEEDVKIFHFNENTEEWELVGGEIDTENQTISTTVTHFSQYGVFVVEDEEPVEPTDPSDPEDPTVPEDPEDPKDPEDPADPEDPTDPEEPGEDPKGDENGTDDEDDQGKNGDDKSDKSDGDSKKVTITDDSSDKGGDGKTLPKTATNMFNLIALGGLLIIIGFVSFFVLRRRVN